jgi:cytochrome c peroxidase
MLRILWCVLLAGSVTAAVAAEVSGQWWSTPVRWAQNRERPNKQLVTLGQRLFFDPGLSASGHTACATCHDPQFAYGDSQRISLLDSGQPGIRNAPSLINVRFRPRLMWDGRFRSLEEQAFDPFRPNSEMGISIEEAAGQISLDPSYSAQFFHVFAQPPSPNGIVRALAAYERTLVAGSSRFDRYFYYKDQLALSRWEQWGFEIFTRRANCATCHVTYIPGIPAPPLFSDFRFRNTGVGFTDFGYGDLGLSAVTFSKRDCGLFRTPSLRNIAVTGPYMHDGSFRTLDEVVAFYNAGGHPNPNLDPIVKPLGLSDQEGGALVAFLYSLTDQQYQYYQTQ